MTTEVNALNVESRDEDLEVSMLSGRDDSLPRGDDVNTAISPLVVWIEVGS